MPQTDYHGWNMPTPGGDDGVWGDVLNTLFDDQLDELIPLQDTKANRPAAGTADRLFLAIDEPFLYRDTGSAWERVDGKQLGTGTVMATGGATPAVDTVLTGVLSSPTQRYRGPFLWIDADPSFNADYAWNYDYSHQWDDSDGEVDFDLTVNWDTDPGAGNDVTLRWEVREG